MEKNGRGSSQNLGDRGSPVSAHFTSSSNYDCIIVCFLLAGLFMIFYDKGDLDYFRIKNIPETIENI